MTKVISTANNPGGRKKQIKPGFRRLAVKSLRLLKQRNFDLLKNYFKAELSNLWKHTTRVHTRYTCNVCGYSGYFLDHGNVLGVIKNSACPACDSRSRHRGLYFIYQDYLKTLSRNVKILHFAPEPVFFPLFKSASNVVYQTADLFLDDVDFKEDIQHLTQDEGTYDAVLCNHVIEHVPYDSSAIKEMSRILTVGGKAFITIPGDFTTKETHYFSELIYNGHYRHYGMDVLEKFQSCFSQVEVIDMSSRDPERNHGIRSSDMVFICTK